MRVASFEAIVRALNDANVPFIVVGGLAVNAHGYGRHTDDVDVVVRLQPDIIRSAFTALASIGYHPRVPITADAFASAEQRARWQAEKGMRVLVFHSDLHRETALDIFVTEPFEFAREYQDCLVEEVAPGLPVRIVTLPTLLRLKREAGRPQDIADIAELRLVEEAGQ